MSDREEALRVKKKVEGQFLDIPGVTGVGVNGSVIVYVEKKDPNTMQFIPQDVEGIPVKVVSTGKFRPLSFPIVSAIYGDRTRRYRPAPGGCSVGHPAITAGTLTGRIVIDGEVYGLSNNHVLNGEWGDNEYGSKGDPILQPGVYDGGTLEDRIGELADWIPVKLSEPNAMDAAIFYSEELADMVLDVGNPDKTVEPEVGMSVKKSGRSSGLTFSKVIDVDASVKVHGWGVAQFDDVAICKPGFGIPGDSGSWVGDENDRTVAQLFAGSSMATVVAKASKIEQAFNGIIVPPIPDLPLSNLAYGIPPLLLGAAITQRTGRR